MFLLLASSLHTGKRPGFYCPRGQRSQEAPKGLKEEQRDWIVEHLSTHAHAHTCTHRPNSPPPKKHTSKIGLYLQCLLLCGSFKS